MSLLTLPRISAPGTIDYSSDFRLTRTTMTLASLLETGQIGVGGWYDVCDIAGVEIDSGYAFKLPSGSMIHSQRRGTSDIFIAVGYAPFTGKRELMAHTIGGMNRVPLTARPYTGHAKDLIRVPQHHAGVHGLSQIRA